MSVYFAVEIGTPLAGYNGCNLPKTAMLGRLESLVCGPKSHDLYVASEGKCLKSNPKNPLRYLISWISNSVK